MLFLKRIFLRESFSVKDISLYICRSAAGLLPLLCGKILEVRTYGNRNFIREWN